VLVASQIIKKSLTASGIFLRSREIMFSPFFSCIAFRISLKILEFVLSLVIVFFLREAKAVSGSK
jgi:hypothetical protein